jgi:hypothetical protein
MKSVIALTACILLSYVHATSIEATRYVNKQGVEVIQNRMPLVHAHQAVMDNGMSTLTHSDSKQSAVHIPPVLQARRDDLRVRILNEELNKESTALDVGRKALKEESARHSSPRALEILSHDVEAREMNVREISKELRAISSS